jgi:hypothetical protein
MMAIAKTLILTSNQEPITTKAIIRAAITNTGTISNIYKIARMTMITTIATIAITSPTPSIQGMIIMVTTAEIMKIEMVPQMGMGLKATHLCTGEIKQKEELIITKMEEIMMGRMAMMNFITKATITAPVTTIPTMVTTVNSIGTITPNKTVRGMGRTIIKVILKYLGNLSISRLTTMPMPMDIVTITKVINKTMNTLGPLKTIINITVTQMHLEIAIHNQ